MTQKYFSKIFILLGLLTFSLCYFGGCGKPNPDGRENVSGKITLNGKTIDPTFTAAISFTSQDKGAVNDGGGGQINQSKYLLTGPDGVKPGKYTVRLFINQYYDVKTGEPATLNTGEYDRVHVSMIPPEFNDKSTLEFEVVKGKKNVFDYDIQTDYVPDPKSIPKANKNKPIVQ